MGCTLAGSLTILIKDIKRSLDPEILFIEPFELVITNEIRTAISMGLRDVTYDIGPFIALVDADSFEFSWQERQQTILNHIVGADVVAISRIDLVQQKYLETIRDALLVCSDINRLLEVSLPYQQGMDDILGMIS